MRAAFAACLLLAIGCTANGPAIAHRSAAPSPSASSMPTLSPGKLASGGVIEYPVPNPLSPGASCFGCGQASLGGIVAGADGNLWFADGGQNKVGRMTPSGAITEFGLPAIVGGPGGITSGPDGNIWITTNALGQGRQDWIVRLGRDGAVTQFQAGTGSGDSGTGPERITSGPDGNLWFTEFWANRIARMTPAGALTEFPIPTLNSAPRGIVAGPDGNLWFVESHFSNTAVARITTAGVVTEYPLGGSVDDQLQPTEIVVGQDGNLWLNQSHPSAPQGEIVRVTPNGSLKTFPMSKGIRPSGMASGPDGNIWFTDPGGNSIGRMSPMGAVRQFALPKRNAQPVGITAGPDGRMWFTEGGGVGSIGGTVPEATLSSGILKFDRASASSTRAVDLTNTGEAALKITAVAVVGSDRAAFTTTRDECTGRLVAVNASCHIEVAFRPSLDLGVRAARLAITDNATGSPHTVSLVAQLPDCTLPLFAQSASTAHGEFLTLRDSGLVADPKGSFVTKGTQSQSQADPVIYGQLPASYDRTAGRWVPASAGAISADGSRYAYIDYSQPFNGQLHVVEVATGRDRMLPLPSGPWGLIGFTTEGISIHASYEGIGSGLTLVNPDTGAVRTVFSDSVVHAISEQVAWIVARNAADTLPEPPGIGGANNEVQSLNLNTGQKTTWLYRPGSNLYVIGASNGTIIVRGEDSGSGFVLLVSAPGQAVPLTVPESGDALPLTSGLIADTNGWWMGSEDGVYLWTSHTGAILVSALTAAPAGACA
jgi:streptogramin lyase